MITWLEQFLVRYPELALFLVIAAGYWIGSFKIGAFSLGPVTGALFAGLFVGRFAHVPVSGMTKSFLFLLFLFGIGYSVGPQFVQSLTSRDGLKPMLLAVVVCIAGLAASLLVAKVLRLDPGFAAGLLSGSLTQSAAMGTATDAINGLALSEADRGRFVAHVAVADAVCYIFGYAGVIIFCTTIAPMLLKFDLRTEALKLEQALGVTRAKPGLASAWRKFELRAYRLAEKIPSCRINCRRGRSACARSAAVHPPAAPRRTRDRSRARHDARSGRRDRALWAARVHRRADRTCRGGGGGQGTPRCADHDRRCSPHEFEACGRTSGMHRGRTGREVSTCDGCVAGIRRFPSQPVSNCSAAICFASSAPNPSWKRRSRRSAPMWIPHASIDFVVLGLAIFLGGVIGVLVTFSVGSVKISLSTSVGTLLAGLVVGIFAVFIRCLGEFPTAPSPL